MSAKAAKAVAGAAAKAVGGAKTARTIAGTIRLVIPAGKAAPTPPLGPALGQKGLNMMEFCKEFNAKTAAIVDELPIPVKVIAYSDRTYKMDLKTPASSFFLKKAAGVEMGSQTAGTSRVGTVSVKHIYEIAKVKQKDTPHLPLESICKTIIGTARSMCAPLPRPLLFLRTFSTHVARSTLLPASHSAAPGVSRW
jgi:large subunit ribosomal protein L11